MQSVSKCALAAMLAAGLSPAQALATQAPNDNASSAAATQQISAQSSDIATQAWWGDEHAINLENGQARSQYVPNNDILAGVYTLNEPSIVYFTASYTGTDGDDSASGMSISSRSLDDTNTQFLASVMYKNQATTFGPVVMPAGSYKITAFWPSSCLGTVTLSYSATPAGCDNVENEYNSSAERATPVTPNTPYRGSLFYEHGDSLSDDFFKATCDRDYYRFDLDSASSVKVQLSGQGPIDVQVVNAENVTYNKNASASGEQLTMTTSTQDGTTYLGDLSCGTLPAGTYYVKVTPNSYQACNNLYDITVATSDPGAKEPDAATIDKAKQELADANDELADATKKQQEAQEAYNNALQELEQAKREAQYDPAAIARGSAGFFEWVGSSNAQYIVENPEAASGLSDTHTNLGADGDATSLENMKHALERMQNVNYYRGLQQLDPLYVYDTIMAQGQIQCNFGAVEMDHAGNHGSKFNVGENLAWGYYNPYDGWYTEEKATYDSAIAAGNTPNYWDVGHYLNIISTDYLYYGCGTNTGTARYGICDEQAFAGSWQFNSLSQKEQAYSSSDYYARFMRYYNKVNGVIDQSYQTAVDNTKAQLDVAVENVTVASAAVAQAQDELARAELGKAPVRRICGTNAADTAIAISQKTFPNGADNVIIVRDDDFADAMSATGLAGALNAPIIMASPKYALSDATLEEIERLGAKSAYIIGGPGAIPTMDMVVAELKHVGVTNAVNLYGNDAADTSAICAQKIAEINTADGVQTDYAVVAMSDNFQDALSMSSFAYAHRTPIILLTSSNNADGRVLTSDSANLLANGALKGSKIIVAGGTGAVRDAALTQSGLSIYKRLAGYDGYDTSNQIANWMVEQGLLNASTVTFACGAEPAKGLDALAGAALAGKNRSVVLLASTQPDYGDAREATVSGSDSEGTKAFLSKYAYNTDWVDVLGGTYVMPETLVSDIKNTLD